jgi:peptidylprolyl isomerase/peptidyl-prolyl cis-trans isomerase B (cyclophilin B)
MHTGRGLTFWLIALALGAGAGQAEAQRMHPTAVIVMQKGGEIRLELYPEEAPKTVESFITLSKKGYFDGLTFHRVVRGFVVQGGDPKGDGTGGPGYSLKAEFNSRKHLRGTLAMARAQDPDSAGSQFYVCLGPQPSLDGKYTVFGQVTAGMEIVDQIRVGDRMKTVRIEEAKP